MTEGFAPVKCTSAPPPPPSGLDCSPLLGGGSVVVYSLFYVLPIVSGDSVFCLCFVMHYFVPSLVLTKSS